jgi:hypothetical protein
VREKKKKKKREKKPYGGGAEPTGWRSEHMAARWHGNGIAVGAELLRGLGGFSPPKPQNVSQIF